MKDTKLLISSLLIFVSFFVWYIFWEEKNISKIKNLQDKKYYINLEIKKTKIDINKDENVILKINWQETSSWSIEIQ